MVALANWICMRRHLFESFSHVTMSRSSMVCTFAVTLRKKMKSEKVTWTCLMDPPEIIKIQISRKLFNYFVKITNII